VHLARLETDAQRDLVVERGGPDFGEVRPRIEEQFVASGRE
jgi:hypothetical protein